MHSIIRGAAIALLVVNLADYTAEVRKLWEGILYLPSTENVNPKIEAGIEWNKKAIENFEKIMIYVKNVEEKEMK